MSCHINRLSLLSIPLQKTNIISWNFVCCEHSDVGMNYRKSRDVQNTVFGAVVYAFVDCLQVLTKSSSKAEVLSCAFYNVFHGNRHSNVVYNFRFPLSSTRCRLSEWRRWQHSPRERRHCRKWFMGTSRGQDGGGDRVTVVRDREAVENAWTVVDNGSLSKLRRRNKSSFNRRVFPRINLPAVDWSALRTHSADVIVHDNNQLVQ